MKQPKRYLDAKRKGKQKSKMREAESMEELRKICEDKAPRSTRINRSIAFAGLSVVHKHSSFTLKYPVIQKRYTSIF